MRTSQAEAVAIAKAIEVAIRAEERLLRNIFASPCYEERRGHTIGERPHSARRASNSRVASAWAASRTDSFPSVPLGWIRTSSCIGLPVKARTLLFRACTMHSKSRAIPVQLPDAAGWDLVHQEKAPLRCDWLDAQLFEERFEVGIVDGDLGLRLALSERLDDTFIEGLEEAHFGDGVFFATGQRAAVLFSPGFHRDWWTKILKRKVDWRSTEMA